MTRWIKTHVQIVILSAITALFILVAVIAVIISTQKNGGNSSGSAAQSITETVSFPDITLPNNIFADLECDHDLCDFTDSYVENNEELIYSYASYPVLTGNGIDHIDVINNSIYEFIVSKSSVKEHEKILAYEKYERASMNAEGFIQFEFMLKTESVVVKEKFVSILFSYTRTVSLSEPSYEYFSLNFDLTNGDSVSFSDIIALDDESAVDYISSIISQDIAINPNIYYPNAKNELQYCIDLNSFYLSNEGAVLFFNPETLTPSVYGVRSFLVPYDKIGYVN
jgi:hypothetical protein